ncbi:MAG: hypothetical protein E3J52_10410 [Promethearchaeota archaeon]|nr:MAG: hypothetical protein E3J52_10410 [Candidatus Lokiarchaeota archaeon]
MMEISRIDENDGKIDQVYSELKIAFLKSIIFVGSLVMLFTGIFELHSENILIAVLAMFKFTFGLLISGLIIFIELDKVRF